MSYSHILHLCHCSHHLSALAYLFSLRLYFLLYIPKVNQVNPEGEMSIVKSNTVSFIREHR